MAGRLFDKLEQEAFRAGIAARTKASMDWFQDRVSNVNVSRAGLLKDGPTSCLLYTSPSPRDS